MEVPGSKSVTNRALLLAALAPGRSRLLRPLRAADTEAMRGALVSAGVPVEEHGDTWEIEGGAPPRPTGPVDVGASGTTLRFLLPWLALGAAAPVELRGAPRLFERPLEGLIGALGPLGCAWSPLGPGRARLDPAPAPPARLDLVVDARASSQFVTGLALCAAGRPGGGRLGFGEVPSRSYLDLTRRWLRAFGVEVREEPSGSWVLPGGALRPAEVLVPGDWSAAAAFLAAGVLVEGGVEVGPLDPADPQGDRALLDLLAAAGAEVGWRGADRVYVKGPLRAGLHADLSLCPDLGPVLAAVAALAPGPSVLTGLHTLPLKECDRLDASAELVRWLGARGEVEGVHTLRVWPGVSAPPSAGLGADATAAPRPPFDPRADHRMAFAAAVGGLRRGGALADPGCVAKTMPDFWERWAGMLGV